MSKKLALITGGTSGIGFGIAKALAPHFDLALNYAADDEKAQKALSEIQNEFPDLKVRLFKQKLSSQPDCAQLFQQVTEAMTCNPSVLVNSAGRLHDGLFLSADFEQYKQIIDEHLIATMALSQLALKSMYKDKWGRIISLSSISSFYAKRGQSNYAAAKAGIEAFSRTLALEVAHRGVTVNSIAPGLIETPMTKQLIEKIEASDGIRSRIPAGRLGQASEVGALAAFLCSSEASYITGTVIPIDGGRSLGDSQS